LVSYFAHGWAVYGVRISLVPLFAVEALHRSAALAGLALTVFAAGNVIVLMFAGRLTDFLGRRRPMLVGLVVSGGATIWLGFTGEVPEFLAASLIAGAGTGLITPAQGATVADVIGSQAKGGPVLATVQMAADVGAILGPIATGLLADQLSYTAAFVLTGAISLLAAAAWLRSPETRPPGDAAPALTPVSAPTRVSRGLGG
ncbi:MAG: MFS transporter, partial [Pseudonocardiaceae bacterium]